MLICAGLLIPPTAVSGSTSPTLLAGETWDYNGYNATGVVFLLVSQTRVVVVNVTPSAYVLNVTSTTVSTNVSATQQLLVAQDSLGWMERVVPGGESSGSCVEQHNYVPAFLSLLFPLEVNESWNQSVQDRYRVFDPVSGQCLVGNESISLSLTVSAQNAVAVGGDTFDAYLIRGSTSGTGALELWYAPDLHFYARMQPALFGEGSEEVLVSHSGGIPVSAGVSPSAPFHVPLRYVAAAVAGVAVVTAATILWVRRRRRTRPREPHPSEKPPLA